MGEWRYVSEIKFCYLDWTHHNVRLFRLILYDAKNNSFKLVLNYKENLGPSQFIEKVVKLTDSSNQES